MNQASNSLVVEISLSPCHAKFIQPCLYRVFTNEYSEAIPYYFGQKASYYLGLVAEVSYIYDILILFLENNQQIIFRQKLGM